MSNGVQNWLIHNDVEDYYYLRRSSDIKYLKNHLNEAETVLGVFAKLKGREREIAEKLKANKVTISGKDLKVRIIPDYYG
jgi:hypothetical protein